MARRIAGQGWLRKCRRLWGNRLVAAKFSPQIIKALVKIIRTLDVQANELEQLHPLPYTL
jgi:hypothetical protein